MAFFSQYYLAGMTGTSIHIKTQHFEVRELNGKKRRNDNKTESTLNLNRSIELTKSWEVYSVANIF